MKSDDYPKKKIHSEPKHIRDPQIGQDIRSVFREVIREEFAPLAQEIEALKADTKAIFQIVNRMRFK